MAQIPAALQSPATSTMARRPDSVRRTSHIDMTLLEGGRLGLSGRARDLRTGGPEAAPEILAEGAVRCLVGSARQLETLDTTPHVNVDSLVGLAVAGGFRAALDRAVPQERDGRSPLYLLLDELPVAALISGYATMYSRGDEGAATAIPADPSPRLGLRHDICAGWRSDGFMMTAFASSGGPPTPVGPAAPDLQPPDDPFSWHEIPSLPVGAMRRRRLIDVAWGDPLVVSAMFRDTHVGPDGIETVLHEYALEMDADPRTMTVSRCASTPHVLPWPECPAAAASAARLEGHAITDLRSLVRGEFRGTSTCTHLNDLLRSLADVAALAQTLR